MSSLFNLLLVCVLRDIMSIYKEPPPGMFVVPDPQDMTKVNVQDEVSTPNSLF